MEITVNALLDVPLLSISGEVDHFSAVALQAAAEGLLPEAGGRLMLDVTACPYMDSGGLAILLRLTLDRRSDGWIGAIGPDHNLSRLFEIIGLTADRRFRVFGTAEEATRVLAQAR